MQQKILPLKLSQEKNFNTFIGKQHQVIIHALKTFDTPSIFLWGEQEVGISHLLASYCNYWQKQGCYAILLDLKQKPDLNTLLKHALDGVQYLAIDHLEAVAGQKIHEEGLFNLFNRGLELSLKMLWGAHTVPDQLGYQLPDLASRLQSSEIFHVTALNDEEKKLSYNIMQKHVVLNFQMKLLSFYLIISLEDLINYLP